MTGLQRRSTDHVPWYTDPAWITIIVAVIVNLVLVGYSFGRLNARVDVIEHNQQHMLDVMVEHSQGHITP